MTDTTLGIRPATPDDIPDILAFIRELAHYEREPAAAQATPADLLRDGFGPTPRFHCLIAELASGQMSVPVTMEMTLAARDYERLGAHAVNIARRVVYLAGSGAIPNPGPTTE